VFRATCDTDIPGFSVSSTISTLRFRPKALSSPNLHDCLFLSVTENAARRPRTLDGQDSVLICDYGEAK
jgi:hypothetical protein